MTNREIAKELGISPATLSLIINKRPGISDVRRIEVITALEKMGYAYLIKKSDIPEDQDIEHNICFVVYKKTGSMLDSSPFFMLVLESIENYAKIFHYRVQYSFLDENEHIDDQISRLNASASRGIIVFATEMTEKDVFAFSNLSVPYVFLDNSFPTLEKDCISINNRLGTAQAVNHLVRRGHSRIGYLRSETRINSFEEREAGYDTALRKHGLSLDQHHIFTLPFSEVACYQQMKTLITDHIDLPTAFVSDDDILTSGVMKALIESGYKVPDDISFVGFNDRPLCELLTPALTTIRVPRYAFGAAAVDLLHTRIAHKRGLLEETDSFKAEIGTKLIIRES